MKPALVFLDAGTIDYGDITLAPLKRLGRFEAFPFSSPQEVLKRSRNVQEVIVNKCVFSRKDLHMLPDLRVIHVAATGVNNVDLTAARERGVAVTNVRGYSTESVTQLTWALILSLVSGLPQMDKAARDGRWSASPTFALVPVFIPEVAGKTLGIIGFGAIGSRVAEAAAAFGMKVLIAKIPGRRYSAADARRRVPLNRLLQASDCVTIHAPLSDVTRGLINRKNLAKMKSSAFLVNMARGGIVDETALAQSLRLGRLRGAALDVLEEEPPRRNHPLFKVPNLLLTPHVGWASIEARSRLVDELVQNVRAFRQGKKRNRIV